MIFLCCHYCWSLLFCNYWWFLMLLNSSSWSRWKLTVQRQVVPHPCDSFFINNRDMTTNSIEKNCFVILIENFQLIIRFRKFYTPFVLNITTFMVCSVRNFCISQQQARNLLTETESQKPCISTAVEGLALWTLISISFV